MRLIYKYLITMAAGLAAVLMIILWKDIFAQTEAVRVYHILCDAFFAVGTVITCVGLLVFTTNEGVFHGVIYAFGSFINMFKKDMNVKNESYYDFKEARSSKKISFGFMLVVGLVFLAVSMIMLLLYLQNQ